MEKEILKKLDGFPSCFHTFNFVQTIEKERKKKILSKVISERDTDGYDSPLEDTIALNFISYMSFAVGNFEDAVKYNSMAIKTSENNINALISKARYHLHKSEFADSCRQCDLLDNLKNDKLEMVHAKADLAYVCSRLGMQMYKKAQILFEETLKESEDTNIGLSQKEICMLKFGLALTIWRQLNISGINTENLDTISEEAQRCNQLLELFINIIKMEGEKLDKQKARSYVQIGETLNSLFMQSKTAVISKHILAYFPEKNIKSKVRGCYKKGYSLQQNDVFVIERYAKYCRMTRQTDLSIELCEHALSIRETSIGHHYWAMALKKKLHFANARHTSCKWAKQNYHKPQHVRDLHMDVNTSLSNQDQQVTNIIDDSVGMSIEPKERPKSSYKTNDDEHNCFSAKEVKATCGERTSAAKPVDDVFEAKHCKMAEHLNLGALKPKTDAFSGQLSKPNRESGCHDLQEVTTLYGESSVQNETRDKQLYDRQNRGNGSYSSNNIEQNCKPNIAWSISNEGNRNRTTNIGGQPTKSRWITESSENARHRTREVPPLHFLSQMIKSPKKPLPLPKDKIGEIISHLDRAMELSENMPAMYDKALVLMAAGQPEEALAFFKSMFQKKDCTLVYLANAYEQSALCLQDQIEKTYINIEFSEVEKMMIDLKDYLLKSIEIECNLIRKQPCLKNRWNSFPTLIHCLLEENPRSKGNIRELGMLHRKVKDYNGAIGWFEKSLEMETNAIDKVTAHMDIVRDCLKAEKYTEAILHLDMVQCLSDRENIIDENLYFEAHIEGGLESFFKCEEAMAGLRLKNAMDYKRRDENQEMMHNQIGRPEQDELFQQEWFDVFVICDPQSETTGRNIWRLLRKLGLQATLNDDYAAPGLPSNSALTKIIERSTHCVVVLGNDIDNTRHIQAVATIAQTEQERRNYGNMVVVVENEYVQVDLMFTRIITITYEQGLTDSNSEDHKPWLKNLLWILASGNKMLG